MMTTTCLMGLGIVPEAVETDVRVPVLVYSVVSVPEMLVILIVEEVVAELWVDAVDAMVEVIEVVVLVI